MADGLHAPKPISGRTRLGRLLIALEVPDCDCPYVPFCVARGKPCQDTCRCFPLPCKHVPDCDHKLTLEDWGKLLESYDPVGYRDRPLDQPANVLTHKARVNLLAERCRRGVALFHPDDRLPDRSDAERVVVLAVKGRRQGGIVDE